MDRSPDNIEAGKENDSRAGVFIKTFGCQMNEYDSEKMFSLLSDSYRPVQDSEQADLIIVNTCSVREKAEHKLFSVLGKYRQMKEKNPSLVLGVGGCVAQQEGDQIIRRNSAVDFVVGTHNISLVPSLVSMAKQGKGAQVAIDYRDEWEDLPEDFQAHPISDSLIPSKAFGVRALVSIQRGCNKQCAFCVVPTTRGPEVSRAADEIVRETRLKVNLGAKEVLLLGQTVNSYGRDLSPRYRFEDLIRRLAEIDGLERIRFTSPHPQDVTPGFVALYGEVPQLCPHIHLPLQSGSDRILKLMNRNYRIRRYLQIVDQLRENCPDIAITSDIIVGFPTETQAEFEETLSVMEKVNFSASYSFKYSRRPNTVAIESFSLDEEIPQDIANERLQHLQNLQERLSLRANEQRIGSTLEVLVEGKSKNISSLMRGRIPQNTLIEIVAGDVNSKAPVKGDLVNVVVDHASPYGLRGRLV